MYNTGRFGRGCLLARRLVEAGVRCVTLSSGGWDTHGNNFKTLKERNLPVLDAGLANLVQDLQQNGMIDDVSIVVWGEFGRLRDHCSATVLRSYTRRPFPCSACCC